MYKIRFNLGRGNNYKKWKVTHIESKRVQYIDPEFYNLVLKGCRLRNRPNAAKRIHEGANKYPCAWIECESFIQVEAKPLGVPYGQVLIPLMYNPKVAPNWVHGHEGRNVDNTYTGIIRTKGNKVYAMEYDKKEYSL